MTHVDNDENVQLADRSTIINDAAAPPQPKRKATERIIRMFKDSIQCLQFSCVLD